VKSRRFLLPVLIPFATAATALAQLASTLPSSSSSVTIDSAAASQVLGDQSQSPLTAAPVAVPAAKSYMGRYRPEAGLFELGLFGGLMHISDEHALGHSNDPHRYFKNWGGELGLRLAYYPLAFLGIEAEGSQVTASIDQGRGAAIWAAGGHLIGQLTAASITPFLLAGAGTLGANSHEMGGASSFAVHVGAGVKVPFDSVLSLRLDVRDTMTGTYQGSSASVAHFPEALLGLTVTLDRAKPAAPPPTPPPPDTDGDGYSDPSDRCPNEKGIAPDGCPPDTDKDGVADSIDQCPNEVGEAPTGCPVAKDTDKDGVLDKYDECPTEAGTMPNGCPDPDPDKDGIKAEKDKCPDQPETVNGFQDDDGCPDELPEVVKRFTGTIAGVEFDFGKATIRPTSFALLDKAAETLTTYPDLKILIVGHTDNVGPRQRNIDLSLKRAQSVKAYLVSKQVDESRVQAEGAGPDKPISTENTAAARAKNRRIEFNIITR
jgi:outer membrane protein OmpA-like peptidoglycan-associated protein